MILYKNIIHMKMKNIHFYLILFFTLNCIIKSEEILEDKYYFQLYPSLDNGQSFLFYAYTPDSRILIINSTEGDKCSITEGGKINAYPINGLSSVIAFNNSLLIKTCFGPDKIVEIVNQKNETFTYKRATTNSQNQNLDNIKFCYSTSIYNPQNSNENIIITYWTEFTLLYGKEKYTHKFILFYPKLNHFSQEIEINSIYNIYARSCITFRNVDIYCTIHTNLLSSESKNNSFTIDTSKIFSSKLEITSVISSSNNGENIYQKPIQINKQIRDILGRNFDAFLTEYHDKDLDKTILVSSLYRKIVSTVWISKSDFFNMYYGVNIEDYYVNPHLFNHLIPNQNDLIIIYTMKTGNDMSLVMTRFNLTNSIQYHKKFKEYSMSNYLRKDICSNPKHIQSFFLNSLINYNSNDNEIIRNIGGNYYKYQRDIITLFACADNNNNVYYEAKKVMMPQCLNILDYINNNDKHIIKFRNNVTDIKLDIYNDPNLLSLRNVDIEFLPSSLIGNLVFFMVKPKNSDYIHIDFTQTFYIKNPTHIIIRKSKNFRSSKTLSILYRLKQTLAGDISTTCHLTSDICNFEFVVEDGIENNCNIEYCLYCIDNICKQCDNDIEGLTLKNNKCNCDEDKGFSSNPKTILNRKICVCKNDYSFYKNTSLCWPNSVLRNGSFYIDGVDDISFIPIYNDCPSECLSCKKVNNKVCCLDCRENMICNCDNDISDDVDIKDPDDTYEQNGSDICLNKKFIWFKMGEYEFIYAKIKDCIYVFYENSLFFYSNKKDCTFSNNFDYSYISKCLKNPELKDINKYNNFLNNYNEYNPNDENVNIIKEIDDYVFHLVNSQTNDNITDLVISDKCIKQLINKYNIENENLLIFKVDIKINITKQIEYQLYNPDPKKIDEILNLSYCLYDEYENETERRLDEQIEIYGIDLKINETNVSIPVNWTEQQYEYIDELYNNKGIFLFNHTEEFYNNVCFSYETSKGTDIYLQDRREKYYITDPICEDGCVLIDYNNITNKIICKCPIKTNTENYSVPNFVQEKIDDIFDETYILPNIRVLKCFIEAFVYTKKNWCFYIILILIIIFIVTYILRKCFKTEYKEQFKKLNDFIEDLNENSNSEEENSNKTDNSDSSNQISSIKEGEKNKLKNDLIKLKNNRNIKNEKKNGNIDEIKKSKVSEYKNNNSEKEKNKMKKTESLISEENNNSSENGNGVTIINIKGKNGELPNITKEEEDMEYMVNPKNSQNPQNPQNPPKKKINIIDINSEKIIKKISERSSQKNDNKYLYMHYQPKNKESYSIHNSKNNQEKKNKKRDIINNFDLLKLKNNKNKIQDITEEKKSSNLNIINNYNDNRDEKDEIFPINEDKEYEENYNSLRILIKSINDKEKNKKKLISNKEEETNINKNNNYFEDEKELKTIKLKGNDKIIDVLIRDEYKEYKLNPPKKKKNKKSTNNNSHETNQENNNNNCHNNLGNGDLNSDGRLYGNNPGEEEEDEDPKLLKNKNHYLNKLKFSKAKKKDLRSFCEMFISIIKTNNIILFIFLNEKIKIKIKNHDGTNTTHETNIINNSENFNEKEINIDNDYFTKAAVVILPFNMFLLLNIVIMINSSSLHLYLGKDINDKFETKYMIINFFFPFISYYLSGYIQSLLSIREFFLDQYENIEMILQKYDKKEMRILRLHNVETEISKYKNKLKSNTEKIFKFGLLFLFLNWYYITCFGGVYNHSLDCLILHTFLSIIFALFVSMIIYALSACIRKRSLDKNSLFHNKKFYNISKKLNPIFCFRKKSKLQKKLKKKDKKNQSENENNNQSHKD